MKRIAGSPDPIQQTLREHKAEWNAGVSELINNLIILKKIMNGREVPGFLGKGDIKHPLPPEVPQLLSQLTEYFSSIAQAGSKIISEQEEYSQVRNKGIKEASNPISRFKTYVKKPFQISDRFRGSRVGILKHFAILNDLTKDIENDLLSTHDLSIFNSFYAALNIGKTFKSGFELFKSSYSDDFDLNYDPNAVDTVQTVNEEPQPEQEVVSEDNPDYEEMAKRYFKIIASTNIYIQSNTELENIQRIKSNLKNLEDSVRRAILADKNKNKNDFINSINSAEDYYNELIKSLPKEAISSLDHSMIKLSHNMISRWFKKQLMNFRTTDQTILRKKAISSIESLREDLNQLMSLLENKAFDFESFISHANDFEKKLAGLFDTMIDLANLHNHMVRMKRIKAKDNKEKYAIDLIPISDISEMKTARNIIKQ